VPGFEVRSSATVHQAGFLDVDELTIADPDGGEFTRYVVRHPGAVVVVPVDRATGRALLVRQYRAPIDTDLLELPAGKRDVDGEPPEVTAVRELEEETGFTAATVVPLARFYNSPGFCDELTHVFLATDLDAVEAEFERKAEEQHLTLEWVDLDGVGQLVSIGAVADAKTIIGLTLARAYLAGAFAGLA